VALNRVDFQQLADVQIAEADVLLAAGMWDGAYYLAGYAVECALKACIAKLTKAEEFPPHRKDIDNYYTHDINKLMRTAKLEAQWQAEVKADPQFAVNWDTAKLWTEESRYARKSEIEARELYDAVSDAAHGVL
jgi:HEPN domain-containing protein